MMQKKQNTQPQIMAVAGAESVGAITYARLTNDVSIKKLRELWTARGFDENLFISAPTAENTLRRALASARHGMRMLLRPLEGKNGFALVAETAKDDQLDYDIQGMLRARIDYPDASHPEQANLTITPANHTQTNSIRARFEELRDTVAATAFGAGWIWRYLAPRCKSVSLRDFGGIYFIPRDMVDQWDAWCDTIEEACPGVKIYRIPAVSGAEALEAIMDSLRMEAETAIASINEELLKTGTEALGKRALRNREAQTREVRNKVAHYERLFQVNLDDLQAQLNSLNTEIAGALLLLADDMLLGEGCDNG
jgi:hypothetical protein